jgi:glycosyl transferase family 25
LGTRSYSLAGLAAPKKDQKMPSGTLFDYFDRISIIHLPERTDRLSALTRELARVGLDVTSPKVSMPVAPKPNEKNDFPSRGVYGNFLSHLEIIQQAYADNLERVLVLEDDAIFSRQFDKMQHTLVESLHANPWDEVFIGHSVARGLPYSNSGLVRFSGDLLWAHCYAIHRRIMPRLIDYLTKVIQRPPGHPDGGKMYIDAAHNLFRRQNPDVVCLVTAPCLSIQRGSRSSLGSSNWYDKDTFLEILASRARCARDELWRYGLIHIGPKGDRLTRIASAQPWPASGRA